MTDNEIVKALLALATSRDNICDNPTVRMLGKEVVLNASADRIEYLQEQLNEESGAAKLYARQRNELREQLSASQAREREALEALEESRAYWKRAETEAIKYQNLYLNYRNEFGYLPDDFVGREEPGEVKHE